eukprot:TRINITY_DN952_c1_g1_i6.p1 TRINITY_DN952_c1_g1~~TRINITY_DN952_c1_g1_i6.p1  ORF type:complete len:449 (-),score=42.92 TRINITY_DN952_c1_g1_i6:1687-3033(-)
MVEHFLICLAIFVVVLIQVVYNQPVDNNGNNPYYTKREVNLSPPSIQVQEYEWLNNDYYPFPRGVEKYEGVFLGEGINCGGTSAKVVTTPRTVTVSNETIVSVVANAIAEAVSEVEGDPTELTVNRAAQESSRKILQVVAKAVAEVSIEINSPNPGCWAIGYGRAKAVAIAEATVTAIASALAKAGDGVLVQVDIEITTNDVQEEIKEIVLRVYRGWGGGFRSESKKVTSYAKATAVSCALARAFAQIVKQKYQAIVLVQDKCFSSHSDRGYYDYRGCECVWQNSHGAPNLCGQFGDEENGDYICYTSQECFCAIKSERYPQLKWRYCGSTLDTMKQWLNVEDSKNEITFADDGNGYCTLWQRDTLAPLPGEPPAPIPSPGPSIYDIVVNLPEFFATNITIPIVETQFVPLITSVTIPIAETQFVPPITSVTIPEYQCTTDSEGNISC